MSEPNRPTLPTVPPDYVPPRMRREERRELDGRRLLLYHFDRTPSSTDGEKKEPCNG